MKMQTLSATASDHTKCPRGYAFSGIPNSWHACASALADFVVVAPLLLATLTASAQALLELTRQTMQGTQCRALLCCLHSKASPFLQWSVSAACKCAFSRTHVPGQRRVARPFRAAAARFWFFVNPCRCLAL